MGGLGIGGQGTAEAAVEVAYAPDEPRQAARSHRRTLRHARALHGRAGQSQAKAVPRVPRHAAKAAKVKPTTAKAACVTFGCRPRTLRG